MLLGELIVIGYDQVLFKQLLFIGVSSQQSSVTFTSPTWVL